MGLPDLINKSRNKAINLAVIILSLVIAMNIYKGHLVRLEGLKAQISEENKKGKVLSGIKQLSEEVDAYRRLLVWKESSLSMAELNNLARESEIKISSIKPLGESALPEYSRYIFELSVVSPDYDRLAKFVNKLEVYKDVYLVDLLDINSTSYNKDKELNATLRVSTIAILD